MPQIKLNDQSIYYEKHGKGDPLILVPGFTQPCQVWLPLLPLLTQTFTVYLIDNRGCGQSQVSDDFFTIDECAKDLVAFLDVLGLQAAHFMGQSMGSMIIQTMACNHPNRVNKIVLCSAFAKLPAVSKYQLQTQMKLLTMGLNQQTLTQLNASWLLSNHFMQDTANIARFYAETEQNPFPQSQEGMKQQAKALFEKDLSQDLSQINAPTLILAGEQDLAAPLFCQEDLHRHIKNSKLHIFKEQAHLFPYEIPEETAKYALGFLCS